MTAMAHCHPLCQHFWVLTPVQKAFIHTSPKMFPLGYNLHIKISTAASVWAIFWCHASVVDLGIFSWNKTVGDLVLVTFKPKGNQSQNSFGMLKWLTCITPWVEKCLEYTKIVSLLQHSLSLSTPISFKSV